jgi:NADH-quinone oxidoreductase subunit J
MDAAFSIFALLLLAGAVAAMSLRNLIHCALSLVVVFFSAAGLFLLLGAEFLSFAQVMVYVGAIAILIVFATLLTGSAGAATGALAFQPWLLGVGTAGLVTGVIVAAVITSRHLPAEGRTATMPTVRQLGEDLMTRYVLPLEVIGLLLTAALIGAVVLALREGGPGRGKEPRP